MTTYLEVGQALVAGGWLSDADIDAAADVVQLAWADDVDYAAAAAALLDAGYITAGNVDDVIAAIDDVWVVD